MVPIPQKITAGIDKIAGVKNRTHFIVEVLEREIRRREQMAALEEAGGCWKDEDHPELANGSEAFIRALRSGAAARLERIHSRVS